MKTHHFLGNALFQRGGWTKQSPGSERPCKSILTNGSPPQPRQRAPPKGPGGRNDCPLPKGAEITPDYPEAQKNLARVLAICPQASLRNGNKAVDLAVRANQLTGDGNPLFLRTLAAAYAEAGRFPEAVKTAQRALQLAETHSNTALADAIRTRTEAVSSRHPIPFTLNKHPGG